MEHPQESLQLIQVPFMSQLRFSQLTGYPVGVVEGWVNRGYVPTILVGKHRAINLVALTQECLDQLPR